MRQGNISAARAGEREDLHGLRPASHRQGWPQLAAHAGERDLPPGRGAGQAAEVGVPGRAEPRDPRVPEAGVEHRVARDRAGDAGAGRERQGSRGGEAALARAALQRADPHHLRRDGGAGRSCEERAAAERRGQRELPDPPRSLGRGGAPGDRERAGRPEDRGRARREGGRRAARHGRRGAAPDRREGQRRCFRGCRSCPP